MTASGGSLDAGTLTASNGKTSLPIPRTGGIYTALLGYSSGTPFLTGGSYQVKGTGGADVGAFSVSVGDAPAVSVSLDTNTVKRSSPLTVKWSATGDISKDLAVITGGNIETVDNSSEVFLCTANASDGTFTVPASILARLPATGAGAVAVGLIPATPQATFSASGITYGFADSLSLDFQLVSFQ
jgi:hypothetical protein